MKRHDDLDLTERDVQWIAGTLAVTATMLNDNATEEQLERNFDQLHRLLLLHYSVSELAMLMSRINALLPKDAPLRFVEHVPAFTSGTTLLQ